MHKSEYIGTTGTVYLVGGAVRDTLLGRAVTDCDWVITGAKAADLKAQGFREVGNQFPVFIAPKSGEEYALARTEIKSQPGHTGFICHFGPEVSLEEDLSRRDLTINAMAQSLDGKLIDYHNGQEDLRRRKLRHVSDAFAEDPLRVLRVARFMAELAPWEFQVTDETQAMLKAMVASGELNDLTAERVWREMARALATPAAGQFFQVLSRLGALDVVWPGLKTHWDDSLPAKVLAVGRAHRLPAEGRYALLAVASLPTEIKLKEMLNHLKQWRDRLRLPNRHHHLAEKLACLHALPEAAGAQKIGDALTRLNLYRQPEDLGILLQMKVLLVAAGGGPDWNRERFQAMAQAASAIRPESLIQAGLSGGALGRALEASRIKAITKMLKSK